MWLVSCRTPPCGRPTRRRCRRKNGRAKGAPKALRRDHKHQPTSVKELALCLPKRAWRTIKWREGAAERLSSRFARARVCVAHRDYQLTESRPEEWLLIEWPEGENEPTKYWLSTLPKTVTFGRLVDLTKLRWRIERDYQDLKQEVGLGHFEGRGWRGFHHHATLCIAAYGFLVSERETNPPLRISFHQAVQQTWSFQRLPTQRLRRCDPNVTSRTRLRRCGED